MRSFTKAADDVLLERARQIKDEGFTDVSDDKYTYGELARAAACYCLSASGCAERPFWPWPAEWFKPRTPREDLVKAGALILAEIERLDRIERKTSKAF